MTIPLGVCSDAAAPPFSEADWDRVFKATPRAWQQKGPTVPTPPPIQMGSLVTQEVSSEHPGLPGV